MSAQLGAALPLLRQPDILPGRLVALAAWDGVPGVVLRGDAPSVELMTESQLLHSALCLF